MTDFELYLETIKKPFRKCVRLSFLQPDNSIAFSLDNNYTRGYNKAYDTRAFIQDGTLNVNLQNGMRRKATITLANLDHNFDFAVNHIWFGQKIRLEMGAVLPDETAYYIPQGVFYISNPSAIRKPSERTITLNLVDKWAYLDGSCYGTLDTAYSIKMTDRDDNPVYIFSVMSDLLKIDKFNFPQKTSDIAKMLDNVTPVYTTYYDDRPYTDDSGNIIYPSQMAYDVEVAADGSSVATVILKLNEMLNAWIGYDATGALRVEPSQDDVENVTRPVLWEFSPQNSIFCGITENYASEDVANDVFIVGESLTGAEIWGRAQNYDPASDTNINLIGNRINRESQPDYTKPEQCISLAQFRLRERTMLQKSVTVECSQIFHLYENGVITIHRTDKDGSPVEKHLIQSYSLPIGETGAMTINATSVADFPKLKILSSQNVDEEEA